MRQIYESSTLIYAPYVRYGTRWGLLDRLVMRHFISSTIRSETTECDTVQSNQISPLRSDYYVIGSAGKSEVKIKHNYQSYEGHALLWYMWLVYKDL